MSWKISLGFNIFKYIKSKMKKKCLLKLYRYNDTGKETLGLLYVDNKFFCYTLEPPWKNNERNVSCIPPDTYKCFIYDSPKRGKVVVLEDVPGRTGIQIHIGNNRDDTEGCILPGLGLVVDKWDISPWVQSSKDALDELIYNQLPQDKFQIDIINLG